MSLRVEGHLTSKSSPLAPVACKLSKQFIVQQHLNAHYKNISKAKSSIDNKCPTSWHKHVNTKDQIRRERLLKSARENNINRDRCNSASQNKSFRSDSADFDNISLPANDKNLYQYDSPKSVGPRIYKNNVKSKIAQLRCYNAPKKKSISRPASSQKARTVNLEHQEVPETHVTREFELSRKDDNDDKRSLKYISFCTDVTNDILEHNIFTSRGIKKIFDEHISNNKYNLKMDEMLEAYENIREELGAEKVTTNRPMIDDFSSMKRDRYDHFDYNYSPENNRSNLWLEDEDKVDFYKSEKGRQSNENWYIDKSNITSSEPRIDKFIDKPKEIHIDPEYPVMNVGVNSERIKSNVVETEQAGYSRNQKSISHEKQEFDNLDKIILTPRSKDESKKHYDNATGPVNSSIIDKIDIHEQQKEYSTAPSTLEWSLTSNEQCNENNAHFSSNRSELSTSHRPGNKIDSMNIDKLCQDIYDVRLKGEDIPEMIDRKAKDGEKIKPTITSNESDEVSNVNRNVHFATHNEVFSAPEEESDDHSLTDITSMRLEESENDNDVDEDDNDSTTCVESSLEMSNTLKIDLSKEIDNAITYDDDFDD